MRTDEIQGFSRLPEPGPCRTHLHGCEEDITLKCSTWMSPCLLDSFVPSLQMTELKVRRGSLIGFFFICIVSAILLAKTVKWVLLSKNYIEGFSARPPFPR